MSSLNSSILALNTGLTPEEEEEKREKEWRAIMAMPSQPQGQRISIKKKRAWDTMGMSSAPPPSEEDFNGNGSKGGLNYLNKI